MRKFSLTALGISVVSVQSTLVSLSLGLQLSQLRYSVHLPTQPMMILRPQRIHMNPFPSFIPSNHVGDIMEGWIPEENEKAKSNVGALKSFTDQPPEINANIAGRLTYEMNMHSGAPVIDPTCDVLSDFARLTRDQLSTLKIIKVSKPAHRRLGIVEAM
jgi:hypothetical protein